jgi:hypothetical protein
VRERAHALDVARRSTSVAAVRRRTRTPRHTGDPRSLRRTFVFCVWRSQTDGIAPHAMRPQATPCRPCCRPANRAAAVPFPRAPPCRAHTVDGSWLFPQGTRAYIRSRSSPAARVASLPRATPLRHGRWRRAPVPACFPSCPAIQAPSLGLLELTRLLVSPTEPQRHRSTRLHGRRLPLLAIAPTPSSAAPGDIPPS